MKCPRPSSVWNWGTIIPLLACLGVILSTALFLSDCGRRRREVGYVGHLPPNLAVAVEQLREDVNR